MRSRVLVGKRGASKTKVYLQSTFAMHDVNPLADDVQVHVRGGTELLCAVLPRERWRKRPSNRFVFQGRIGSSPSRLSKAVIRPRANGDVRLKMWMPIDTTRSASPELTVTVGSLARCSRGTVPMHRRKETAAAPQPY